MFCGGWAQFRRKLIFTRRTYFEADDRFLIRLDDLVALMGVTTIGDTVLLLSEMLEGFFVSTRLVLRDEGGDSWVDEEIAKPEHGISMKLAIRWSNVGGDVEGVSVLSLL